MIIGKTYHLPTAISRHTGSTVARIANIAHVIDYEGDDGARPAPVNVSNLILLSLCELQEQLLSLFEAIFDRLDRLLREVLVLDDELVEVVPEEVGTDMTTVSIVDPEEGAFWPLLPRKLFRLRLHNVEDDGYSIFVIIPDDSLVCIGAVSCHDPVSLRRILCWLVVRHQLLYILRGPLPDLSSDSLVKVFTDLSVTIRAIVVPLCSLYPLIYVSRRSLL